MDRQAIEEQLKRQGGTIKELSPITKFLFVICTAVLSILFGGPVYIAVISAVYIILSLFAHVFKGFFKSYFKLFVFFGLMLTPKGMKVIEYNARFGDPETQVVLPRLKTDLMEIFEACVDGTLDKVDVQWEDNAAACVVMASGGYPVSYKKGYEITGLEDAEAMDNITVFHAGTALKDGKFVTNGGRVLGVTGVGENLDEAIKTAYENADLSGVDKSKYYVTSGNVIDDKALQDEIGYDKYDVVVANIIADVICAISPVVPKQLKKGGVFIASGIIKDRIDDVYKALAEVGLKVIDTSIKDEWVSITSIKE